MIGTKFNARITYIGNCLGALRAARPKVHTVNETPNQQALMELRLGIKQ